MPVVSAWFSPLEAIEKFVPPELVREDSRARQRAENLGEKVRALQNSHGPHLEDVIAQFNDDKFVAEQRRQEVMENLF